MLPKFIGEKKLSEVLPYLELIAMAARINSIFIFFSFKLASNIKKNINSTM